MLYTYPDYYQDFKCIADRCQDTCCAGWQIVVDDESLSKYRKFIKESTGDNKKTASENHPFEDRLEKSVDWQEGVFKQDSCRRCAFLNEQNLCDLYTALGEESLCHTCASYPRHTEEFEDVREVTLSLSCPEVARMVMAKMDKATFYDVDKPDEVEDYDAFEEFDGLMFGILQDARSVMIDILQDRARDIGTRLALVWSMAEDMQDSIDEGAIFDCQDIIDAYGQTISATNGTFTTGDVFTTGDISVNIDIAGTLKEMNRSFASKSPSERHNIALSMFKNLYTLEVLNEAWEEQVDRTALELYSHGAGHYEALSVEFHKWLESNMPNWQIQCEQIAVYFIATYLCGAVYDGWVAPKVKMSVASVFYIHEMLMAQWAWQGNTLSDQDIINMVYRYSRELEHSDINLEELESCFVSQ